MATCRNREIENNAENETDNATEDVPECREVN